MKSLSFNQDQNTSNRKNNLSGGKTKKFKSTKYEKIKFELLFISLLKDKGNI